MDYTIYYQNTLYGVHCKTPYEVYEQLMKNAPQNLTKNEKHNIAAEAQSWCELACIGEEYEGEFFKIKITEY